jgi:hypothetical protein
MPPGPTDRVRSAPPCAVHQPSRWEARQRVREPQDEEEETDSGRREAPLVSKQGKEREDHALNEKAAD